MSFFRGRPAFARLFAASFVSQVGTQVTVLVLPLLALNSLHASTMQVSILGFVEFIPFLLVGLQAGAIVDRRERVALMLVCDAVRAIALLSIPLAWYLGVRHLWLLLAVALVVGTATVFFDVAAQSFLPEIVVASDLGPANQVLAVGESVSRSGGPALGGLLARILSGPTAILADVFSYVVSFLLLLRSRAAPVPAPPVDATDGPSLRTQIVEGLTFIRHHPTLAPLVMTMTALNLFGSIQTAVLVTFMVRTLHYSPLVVGIMFAIGNLGSVVGGSVSIRILDRLGLGRALWQFVFVAGVGSTVAAFAHGSRSYLLFGAAFCLVTFSAVISNVAQVSYRQAVTPARLQGRMNATFRFLAWGISPIGFLMGGYFGTVLGVRNAMLIAGLAQLFPWMLLRYSAVNDLTSLADVQADVSEGALVAR